MQQARVRWLLLQQVTAQGQRFFIASCVGQVVRLLDARVEIPGSAAAKQLVEKMTCHAKICFHH